MTCTVNIMVVPIEISTRELLILDQGMNKLCKISKRLAFIPKWLTCVEKLSSQWIHWTGICSEISSQIVSLCCPIFVPEIRVQENRVATKWLQTDLHHTKFCYCVCEVETMLQARGPERTTLRCYGEHEAIAKDRRWDAVCGISTLPIGHPSCQHPLNTTLHCCDAIMILKNTFVGSYSLLG